LKPISPLSSKTPYFDDLPSEAVSMLVHTGLVLWGPEVDEVKEVKLTNTVDLVGSSTQHDPADNAEGRAHSNLGLPDSDPSTEQLRPSSPTSIIQADAALDMRADVTA
jgi:hypothetical protein